MTRPAPTVLPPSRMANFRPSSMAMGWMSCTFMVVLSPGITISVHLGRVTTPVTSVAMGTPTSSRLLSISSPSGTSPTVTRRAVTAGPALTAGP